MGHQFTIIDESLQVQFVSKLIKSHSELKYQGFGLVAWPANPKPQYLTSKEREKNQLSFKLDLLKLSYMDSVTKTQSNEVLTGEFFFNSTTFPLIWCRALKWSKHKTSQIAFPLVYTKHNLSTGPNQTFKCFFSLVHHIL